MVKSLYDLTKVQICNFFSLNEARFSKDEKKRKSVRALLVAYAVLGVMLIFYSAGMVVALNEFGLASVTPIYLGVLSMTLSFGLTFLKAGALFDIKAYEKLAVLPVENAVVVASRFLSLYLANFLFTFVIMVSGGITYGVLSAQGVWYYFSICSSSVFMPLLPMVLALALGVVLYSVLSRFKGNGMMKTLLTCAFVIVCFAFPSFFQDRPDSELLNGIATALQNIGGFVIPLEWLSKGVYFSGIGYYFLFVGVSVLVFAVFSALVGKFYKDICSGLSATVSKGKYAFKEMKTQSSLFALYKRELKGYVSSSLYFMNTCMGNLMALILAVAVCFTDVSAIFIGTGLDSQTVARMIPFVFALAIGLMASTACAISMEGKCWDLTKSLPVPAKTLMDAKILTCLTFSVPSALIGEIALLIGLKPTGVMIFATLIIPIAVAVFVAVAGLWINVKFPLLNWDNEAQAVKQSSSVLVAMLVGLATGGLPLILSLVIPGDLFILGIVGYLLVLAVVGGLFYQKLSKLSLNDIDEK